MGHSFPSSLVKSGPSDSQSENIWVVLTGGNRGIGAAVRQVLLREGYGIVHVCRHAPALTEREVVVEADLGVPLLPCILDAISSQCLQLSQSQPSAVIHGFIHCAGVLGFLGLTTEGAENAFSVNTLSLMQLVPLLLPYLKPTSARAPFVLHVSSGAAVNPYIGWEVYCASKAAALMYFRCLGSRYQKEQLRVFSIAPGTIYTDMMKEVLGQDPEKFPDHQKFVELRDTGKLRPPEEVAEKILSILHHESIEHSEIAIDHLENGALLDLRIF